MNWFTIEDTNTEILQSEAIDFNLAILEGNIIYTFS